VLLALALAGEDGETLQEEGKLGRRQTLSNHHASNRLGELNFYNAMSTQRHKFGYQPCFADEPPSTPGLGRVCIVEYP
jgi:hypothetical protein